MKRNWHRRHTRRHIHHHFRRRKQFPILKIILIVVAILLIANYWEEISDTFSVTPKDIPLIESEIHRLVNEERAKYGVHSLEQVSYLNDWSRKHSEKMINESFFEHSNYNVGENIGETPIHYDVIGCGSTYSNEAIAECFVTGWIGSPGHHQNMIDFTYVITGIGVSCSGSICRATQMFE